MTTTKFIDKEGKTLVIESYPNREILFVADEDYQHGLRRIIPEEGPAFWTIFLPETINLRKYKYGLRDCLLHIARITIDHHLEKLNEEAQAELIKAFYVMKYNKILNL